MPSVPAAILAAQHIALVSHIRPDGDAIGSLVALSLGLASLGKKCEAVLLDSVPPAFSFLPGSDQLTSTFPEEVDLCIAVDVSDCLRTGYPEMITRLSKEGKLVLIDHHPKGDLASLSSAQIHNPAASSSAELIYQLLQDLQVRLTPAIATALLTGLITDTGNFSHANTTSYSLEIAAELLKRGGQHAHIVKELNQLKSLANLKLIGRALQSLRVIYSGTIAISVITHQDLEESGASQLDLTGIMSHLNVVPGVQFCLLLMESVPGEIRGRLRTSPGSKVTVDYLARLLGGGGHPQAAGFSLAGHLHLDEDESIRIVAEPEENS